MAAEVPSRRGRAAASPRWRAARGFATRRGRAVAAAAVALLCAVVALLRGQDANWDLRNYHLHNAWALLEGRVGTDLAPAQMQSYFPPLLDVPYYLLALHAPAPLAGLLLGLVHGLAFLPVAWVAWRVLAGDPRRDRRAPLLALAGLASAAFLSELGNTMGDATTAPLVLGALALALPDEDGRWRSARILPAGLLLGAAVALKLTNASYAVALGLAVLAAPAPWSARLWAATRLTLAALAAFAVLAGPWLATLWSTFGNPLFPQFNAWFQAPLAQPVSMVDRRWVPAGAGEALLWPLLFTADPYRASEVALPQVAWALLYLCAAVAAAAWLVRRVRGGSRHAGGADAGAGGAAAARMSGVFFLAGFALWLGLFGIHRYLVVLELLAPLMLWRLVHGALPARLAGRAAAGAVALSAAVALAGWNGWGHAGWHRDAFRVERPDGPPPAAVLLVGDHPHAWRVPFLWPASTYAAVGSNFPESPAYAARVRRIAAQGEVLAMLSSPTADLAEAARRLAARIDALNRWAGWLRLDRGGCAVMRAVDRRSRRIELVPPQSGRRCRFAAAAGPGAAEAERAGLERAGAILARYGLALDAAACREYRSWIGSKGFPYRLCRVRGAD